MVLGWYWARHLDKDVVSLVLIGSLISVVTRVLLVGSLLRVELGEDAGWNLVVLQVLALDCCAILHLHS